MSLCSPPVLVLALALAMVQMQRAPALLTSFPA